MGRKSAIEHLPGAIIRELRERFVSSSHGSFEEHQQWLKEKGYEVSISSIHRYSQAMRRNGHGEGNGDTGDRIVDLRMRCAEVAFRSGHKSDPFELSKRLLFWVTTGRQAD